MQKQNWTFLKETGSDGLHLFCVCVSAYIPICILSLSVILVLVLIVDTNLFRCHAWMLKTDSVVRCIRTVYRCLLCSTSTAREWVLHLAPGGFFLYDTTTPVSSDCSEPGCGTGGCIAPSSHSHPRDKPQVSYVDNCKSTYSGIPNFGRIQEG
jgi:hypothetical protein